jgi:hypothetical protein
MHVISPQHVLFVYFKTFIKVHQMQNNYKSVIIGVENYIPLIFLQPKSLKILVAFESKETHVDEHVR